MQTILSVMDQLKEKGTDKTRKTYVRHGIDPSKTFGVSVADLKLIAKENKGKQELALELFETGNNDAMYLAGMIADGSKMTAEQLHKCLERAGDLQMITEYALPWVAVESKHGRELALQWIESEKEHTAAAGWNTYAGLVATKPDQELDLGEVKELLAIIQSKIKNAKNRERYAMNGFVIAVGSYVKPLLGYAKEIAENIGEVSVEMGDTACKVPIATEYIDKVESKGRIGLKRKSIRA